MSTYTPIASVTLSSAQSSVTFSGIPQTYTDLVLVAAGSASGNANSWIQLNGDTGSNYSITRINGNGTTASSARRSNDSLGILLDFAGANTGSHNYIIQFNNYSNTTTNKTVLSKFSQAGQEVNAVVGLWRNTNAITSLRFYLDTANFSSGSTFNLYGVANASITNVAKATGGDSVTTDGTYWYHTFRSSGTFTPTQALNCDILAVAGGGGGGTYRGGGGGAGGVIYWASRSLTATANTVTVGAGGGNSTNGSNSQFASLTVAVGGGAGSNATGSNGGSGGGGGYDNGTAGTSTQTGTGATASYGNNAGILTSGATSGGAGGGGAGAVGGNAGNLTGGAGGIGINTYSSWHSATATGVGGYIAGGGGGGGNTSGGTGGSGGGGNGGTNGAVATDAIANTGGGGGGGGDQGSAPGYNGRAGGSGIVIVRYAV